MKSFKEFLIESKEKINHKLVDMKILNEMSTICKKSDQAGFIAQIYSKDHNPPHIHIFNMNNREVGEIYITEKQPKSKKDIIVYKGNISETVKEYIYQWSNKINKNGILNWELAKIAWEINHDEDEVKFK